MGVKFDLGRISIHVFLGPRFLGHRFFWVQIFQNLGFSGSKLFGVRVFQVLGPGLGVSFRSILVFRALTLQQYSNNLLIFQGLCFSYGLVKAHKFWWEKLEGFGNIGELPTFSLLTKHFYRNWLRFFWKWEMSKV